ncbi:hypothetical protein MNBD_NITROSPINAE04-1021 [hydrothermal vent metagenome]|uniref:Uncharacterized protein n=1 Tax=hydrothermal vent metagenome TaxID=652676 RepID=A0A3B1BTI8_9ZZZZ
MLIGVFFTPMYQRDRPEVKNTSGSVIITGYIIHTAAD